MYIHGEDSMVADALSRLPDEEHKSKAPHVVWGVGVNATLSISIDHSVLNAIMDSYKSDSFCKKVSKMNIPGVKLVNGLWYISSHLLIPRIGNICEQLYHLERDTLGHFGSDKSYATLRDAYYWPNMWRALKKVYIPSCPDCQWNKLATTKLPGPLHPLPVLDEQGQSIAMDVIRPLKDDFGFNCILTITDHLGADLRIIPTHTDISAENLATLFLTIGIMKMVCL